MFVVSCVRGWVGNLLDEVGLKMLVARTVVEGGGDGMCWRGCVEIIVVRGFHNSFISRMSVN
jgi:hypothetical protein